MERHIRARQPRSRHRDLSAPDRSVRIGHGRRQGRGEADAQHARNVDGGRGQWRRHALPEPPGLPVLRRGVLRPHPVPAAPRGPLVPQAVAVQPVRPPVQAPLRLCQPPRRSPTHLTTRAGWSSLWRDSTEDDV